MNYSDKIKESRNKAYEHTTATKILDSLGKLRKFATDSSRRRWIWELIQNAKDVSFTNKQVDILIDYVVNEEQSELKFSHNGRPFSLDNITFLIEQVSTKDRNITDNAIQTTGKFGTGFLSTHLLSEKVIIDGVINENGLPIQKFNLLLDRSGRSIEEISTSVNNAIKLLDNLDSQPTFNEYNQENLNTAFTYILEGKGIEVANSGINDLGASLPFTLAFQPKIKSVKITSKDVIYEVVSEAEEFKGPIRIITIRKTYADRQEDVRIATLTSEFTIIAIEIYYKDDEIYLKEFDEMLPRLFCDFPLIGSENFYFPTVIQNRNFSPTEPRDGIELTDNEDPDIEQNKLILTEAVLLYSNLLEFAVQNKWQNLYCLAQFFEPKEKEWLSIKWYKEHVFEKLRQVLIYKPIVTTTTGDNLSIKINSLGSGSEHFGIYFPYSDIEDCRERIGEITSEWFPNKIPAKKDIDKWYTINKPWEDYFKFSLEVIANSIGSRNNIEKLSIEFSKSIEETCLWLNKVYALIYQYNSDNIFNKYKFIPNQNGTFIKTLDLRIDLDIDFELKNILKVLNKDWNDFLLNSLIILPEGIVNGVKSQQNVIDEINTTLTNDKTTNALDAAYILISCFSNDPGFPKERNQLYQFSKDLLKDNIPEKKLITNWNKTIWEIGDKFVIKQIIATISAQRNVENLYNLLLIDNTIKWLNSFIKFLLESDLDSQLNLKKNPILPNQNGVFKIKDDLFLDDGGIDEILKNICIELGYDSRDSLLDKSIYLELPDNRVRHSIDLAKEIIERVKPLLTEINRSLFTKQAFQNLYSWFSSNATLAETIFGDLYINRHKLISDDDIVRMVRQNQELENFFKEENISNLSELKAILLASRQAKENLEKESSSIKPSVLSVDDILSTLGIGSEERLREFLKDTDTSNEYTISMQSGLERLEFVKQIIEEAKKAVWLRLSKEPDYDITTWNPIQDTVIDGVKYKTKKIFLVIRPAINGMIYFYYKEEYQALDIPETQLWIHEGGDEVSQISIGTLLDWVNKRRVIIYDRIFN
ncbi:sacsin N-terminal ATP-binding-like domain-containing protein [Spirosoma spitsbergense]|uniref:sacsin N-terminal ATP-binding-like domain-containing protein n=1 Tax=Spirosoma spitsbergense TaxID=431554 RepID=UPI0003707D2C|nr:hypothetical protein [Spirosoma spitsbergense]